jgi:hypothetical protein
VGWQGQINFDRIADARVLVYFTIQWLFTGFETDFVKLFGLDYDIKLFLLDQPGKLGYGKMYSLSEVGPPVP